MPLTIECWILVNLPDSKIRVGMKISNIIWGWSLYTIDVESPIMPKLYLKYPKNVPNTRSIGVYGILYLLLIYRNPVPTRIPKMIKNITRGPLWL